MAETRTAQGVQCMLESTICIHRRRSDPFCWLRVHDSKVFFLNMFYFKDAMKLPSLASVAALTFVPDHVYEKITRTWTEINIEITGFCFITYELFLSIFYSSFLVTSALCLQTSDSSIFVV